MEYLDLVDRNGQPTGQVVARSRVHREGLPHRTSHVWLIRRRQGILEILLQLRSACKDSFPGCYDISSAGHIPAGCGHLESALRELQEELGLKASGEELRLCGYRMDTADGFFHGEPFHDVEYAAIYVLPCFLEETEFQLQEEEVESVRWFPLADAIEGVRDATIPNCIKLRELELVWEQLITHPEWI